MPQPLDPSLATVLEVFPNFTVTNETLPGMRTMFESMEAMPRSGAVEWEDRVVPGDPDITVRVHRKAGAASNEAKPGVYSIHGGGYVLGSYAMDDMRFDAWCDHLDCVGVSVEYRLAPEHPYPAPLDDCYAGLRWMHEHAAELGVDPNCIGIGGLSAGGGLAAALALLARDRGELPVAFQLLDCPMLDDRQRTVSSQEVDLPIWNRESNTYGWQSYLGARYGTDDIPYHAAPARAVDLSGLPPAFVAVGSVDGFRDEDIDYALRLNQAGVPTELHVYPGVPHGFGMFTDLPLAIQANGDIESWLARQFAARHVTSPAAG